MSNPTFLFSPVSPSLGVLYRELGIHRVVVRLGSRYGEAFGGVGVTTIGTDALRLDCLASVEMLPHDALLVRGILIIPIMENLTNLEHFPPACFFMAIPLKIYEGPASLSSLVLVPEGE